MLRIRWPGGFGRRWAWLRVPPNLSTPRRIVAPAAARRGWAWTEALVRQLRPSGAKLAPRPPQPEGSTAIPSPRRTSLPPRSHTTTQPRGGGLQPNLAMARRLRATVTAMVPLEGGRRPRGSSAALPLRGVAPVREPVRPRTPTTAGRQRALKVGPPQHRTPEQNPKGGMRHPREEG